MEKSGLPVIKYLQASFSGILYLLQILNDVDVDVDVALLSTSIVTPGYRAGSPH
jgi:hypothetical protein